MMGPTRRGFQVRDRFPPFAAGRILQNDTVSLPQRMGHPESLIPVVLLWPGRWGRRRLRRTLLGRARLLWTVSRGRVRHRRSVLIVVRWPWLRWQLFFDRLAREHLVTLRRHINKRRHNHCHLLQVFRLKAVVNVHVGVVGARVVLDGVL